MDLNKWISSLKIYLGGTDNSIIFANILSFLAALLLVIVTVIYVIYVSKSGRFSESHSKFKLTDDLGKEMEHEITNSILKISEIYEKYKTIGKKYKDFDKIDRLNFIHHIGRIHSYFIRVYLNYKYNKIDKKIFLEQLSGFVVSYKKNVIDILVEQMGDDRNILEGKYFNEIYKICNNYIDKKDKEISN